MALRDAERELIVIRIVYDGPALSGKTTTLRALAGSLGRDLFSGDEAEGRTLYCDWLDYTGGRFEGYAIRCQVVSVPGQRSLRARRARILETADAVVFVADTRRPQLEASAGVLSSLRELAGSRAHPRPGAVVQANKRDAADAAPMDEVRAWLGADGGVAIAESVATTGLGVRETFVLAVRLALDRVRELMKRSALPVGRPEIDSGTDLLQALRDAEEDTEPAPAPLGLTGLREALAAETAAPADAVMPSATTPPPLPKAGVPGGMIWPPVEGRIVLHEAVADPASLERLPDGSWRAVSGRWSLFTYASDVYGDGEEARTRLIEWARWHSSVHPRLSSHRCILVDTANGAWRLWQIVREERTLRMALGELLAREEPEAIAQGCLELSRALAQGVEGCAASGLRGTVDEIGLAETGWVYVGRAPAVNTLRTPGAAAAPDFEETLRAEFGPVIAHGVSASSLDVPRVLRYLTPLATAAGQPRVGEALAAMLIGH